MYLTDLRVSALALFCSVALVLGATHYARASQSCAGCVEVEPISSASAVQATPAVSEESKAVVPSGSIG